MQILGIQFALLRKPMKRGLQILAAAAWFITFGFGCYIGLFFSFYLLFTRVWWLVLIYFGWIYLDLEISEKGGRPIKWVQNWKLWYYFRDYFPFHLACVPNVKLDPKRNYLFACFPHGVLPTGAFNAFSSGASEFRKLFPEFETRAATIHQLYYMPFFREFALWMGGMSVSAKALNYFLSRPEGGKIAVLTPGGAAESYYSRPGRYKIILKKRKGFVKLALKNGSPLVPVFSFGETDLFDQIEGPKIHKFQELFRQYTGIAPLLLIGRGFFQNSFGIIPRRREITTLVGNSIEVTKTDNPTQEEIDNLHETFVQELKKMFEEYKYKYLKNPEDKFLEIE